MRHGEARAELHRLHLAAPDEIRPGDPGREAHVVLDAARRARLAADRHVLDDQRRQPLGPGVDARGDARRTAADDQHVVGLLAVDAEVDAHQVRDLRRGGVLDELPLAVDDGGFRRPDPAGVPDLLRLVLVERQVPDRDAVLAGERGDAPDVPVDLGADQRQARVVALEQAATARGEHRDDAIAQLRHAAHQREHRLARHGDQTARSHRPRAHHVTSAVEEGDLAEVLAGAERRVAVAPAGGGVDRLDLAALEVPEQVDRVAEPREPLAGGKLAGLPGGAHRLDVRVVERGADHRLEIGGEGFHRRGAPGAWRGSARCRRPEG